MPVRVKCRNSTLQVELVTVGMSRSSPDWVGQHDVLHALVCLLPTDSKGSNHYLESNRLVLRRLLRRTDLLVSVPSDRDALTSAARVNGNKPWLLTKQLHILWAILNILFQPNKYKCASLIYLTLPEFQVLGVLLMIAC